MVEVWTVVTLNKRQMCAKLLILARSIVKLPRQKVGDHIASCSPNRYLKVGPLEKHSSNSHNLWISLPSVHCSFFENSSGTKNMNDHTFKYIYDITRPLTHSLKKDYPLFSHVSSQSSTLFCYYHVLTKL